MVYKENSNTFLYKSGIECDDNGIREVFRNCGWSWNLYQSMQEMNVIKNATNISGSVTLIADNYAPERHIDMASCVRNKDYIYTQYSDASTDSACNFVVREYQISTGTTKDVVAFHYTPNIYGQGPHDMNFSFLDERKIILWVEDFATDNMCNVYIVDFETETSSLSLQFDTHTSWSYAGYKPTDPYMIMTLKKDDNDIWIYIVGWDYYTNGAPSYDTGGGVYVYYKNYTQNTAWEIVHACITTIPIGGREVICYQNPQFIKKDYIVIIGSSSYVEVGYPSPGGIIGFVFNLNTNTIAMTNEIINQANYIESLCYCSAPDNDTGTLYFSEYQHILSGVCCMKLDPSTLEISTVYISPDPELDFDLPVISSRHKAYFSDLERENLFLANPLTKLGDFMLDDWYGWGDSHTCMILDDKGPSIWRWNNLILTLERLKLDGTILASYYLSSINNNSNSAILHLGDCLMIVVRPEGSIYCKYYLIT